MTLNKLHKLLGKLIEQGHGRREVCVDKPTFTHPLEQDGVLYQDISGVRAECYEMCDGDGFLDTLANGTTKTRTGILIYGNAYLPEGKPTGGDK